MKRLIIICLLLIVACVSVADPPCLHLTDFPLVSDNPCLRGPYGDDPNSDIIQIIPAGWQIVNDLVNADGNIDDQTQTAYIIPNEAGLEVWFNNSVHGIDGRYKFEQTINLESGCYLGKAITSGRNNDPPHADNFALSFYLDDLWINAELIPLQGRGELIYPFVVTVDGEYKITFSVDVLWGSAGHNGHIILRALGVMHVGPDYCG